jgi:hypothetical protein
MSNESILPPLHNNTNADSPAEQTNLATPPQQSQVLHVNVRPYSPTEQKYLPSQRRQAEVTPSVIASGIQPHPEYDVVYRGGKTIPHLTFTNFYLGGDSVWQNQDRSNIDRAISAAMSDTNLNNVVQQYFSQPITSTFRPSTVNSAALPSPITQASTEQLLASMYQQNQLQGYDYSQTVFCFICPSGAVLTDNGTVDSLNGLGGYHGSVNVSGTALFYAIVAYAENLANGQQNGIVAFDQPWKNITAALYHELNEARTDADVNGTPGWISNPIADFGNQQVEIGDTPVFEAGNNLSLVFKEVPLTNGNGTVPIQLMYSNAVHGPEGPHPASNQQTPSSAGTSSGSSSPSTIIIIGIVLLIIVLAIVAYFLFFHH